jgi:hypothetical protein
VNDSTDLESAWRDVIENKVKALGLSRKSGRAIIRQVAAMAAYDPEKALSILNSLCPADSDTDSDMETPANVTVTKK